MKFLVLAVLATCALAKPVEKSLEKRQLNEYPFVSQYVNQPFAKSVPWQFQGLEQSDKIPSGYYNQYSFGSQAPVLGSGIVNDQTYVQGISSLNNVQPEITNIGNSGLNSNAAISTTTVSPSTFSSESFSLPTSTISPLISSDISSGVASGVFTQNILSTPSPLSEISNAYSPSTLNSVNFVSSTPIPTEFVQNRYISNNNFLLDNLNQGVDLSSFNFNNLNSNQATFDIQTNYDAKPAEVTKNFYFYEAPEDLEPVRQRKIVQLPAQKVNHKILVIKAPAAPEPQPIEIPAQVLNSEKTRVYVLVKKPETEQQVRIVPGPAAKPEKPEVFFIKYKTHEEAERAIQEAQSGAAYGQESLNVDGQQLLSHLKFKQTKVAQPVENVYVKQTVQSVPSVPVNFVQSSTALPFVSSTPLPIVSSTGSIGSFFESSTAAPLLNTANFDQFSYYNNPLLANKFVATPQNAVYSNGNNFFPYGNFGIRSNVFGSYPLNPTYVSSGYSNIPLELSQKPIVGFRSARIDTAEEKKDVVSENVSSLENSPVIVKDEPIKVTVGDSEGNTAASIPEEVNEYTSNNGSTEVDSTTTPASL